MRYIPSSNVVYMPWTKGEQVNLAVSHDRGDDVDRLQGRGGRHRQGRDRGLRGRRPRLGRQRLRRLGRLVRLPHVAERRARGEARCVQPVGRRRRGDRPTASRPSTRASSTPVQVDRDAVRTTVFPWVAAGGAPGRVAVAFYGTTSDGDPNTGDFKAAWNVYVNQSLNALDASRTFSQVQRDHASVPLRLDLPERARLRSRRPGRRPDARRLLRDRLRPGRRPPVRRLRPRQQEAGRVAGHIATPMVATQIAGPSNSGGTVTDDRPRDRAHVVDRPDGRRAIELLAHGARRRTARPADEERAGGGLHLRRRSASDAATGGFNVTLKVASLSPASLLAGAHRHGRPVAPLGLAVRERLPGLGREHALEPAAGVHVRLERLHDRRLAVPRRRRTRRATSASSIRAASRCRDGRPADRDDHAHRSEDVPAPAHRGRRRRAAARAAGGEAGARFYDGTAFSFANTTGATQDTQSFLYPLDNTPAMDFTLP